MEKKLDKLEGKIDALDDRLDKIEITLAKNTVSLIEHVKRTNLLEKRINSIPGKILTYVSLAGGIFTLLSKIKGL